MVDGRIVVEERVVKTIDEDALRREVAGLMRHFIADYDAVVASRARALPYMRDATAASGPTTSACSGSLGGRGRRGKGSRAGAHFE